jgi:hypothetical protein
MLTTNFYTRNMPRGRNFWFKRGPFSALPLCKFALPRNKNNKGDHFFAKAEIGSNPSPSQPTCQLAQQKKE